MEPPYVRFNATPVDIFPTWCSTQCRPVPMVLGREMHCVGTLIGLFDEYLHRLTSPMIGTLHELPFRRDQPEVGTLSGRVSPARWQALSARLQNGLRFLRLLLPPAPSPFLTVGIPRKRGVHGAYPVGDRGDTNQRGWRLSPGRTPDVVTRGRNERPAHLPFWSQRISLLSLLVDHEVYQRFTFVQPSGPSLAPWPPEAGSGRVVVPEASDVGSRLRLLR